MKILLAILLCFSIQIPGITQTIEKKLEVAYAAFESDEQLKHATSSLYVIDANTGEIVFEKNAIVGLAPASTQKIITSVTAFELLGPDFQYKTTVSHNGTIKAGILNGDILITGSGDPSLGSWRYSSTREEVIWDNWIEAMKKKGITTIKGRIIGDGSRWESQTIPGGWMWDDIGNYYGAGSSALNWRENQYDLVLNPGQKVGDPCTIVKSQPFLHNVSLVSELTTGKKGSGDNAYIYLPPYSDYGYVRGTIPLGEPGFTISGSVPNPESQLVLSFAKYLDEKKVGNEGTGKFSNSNGFDKVITTHFSPTLDSIIFWFNRRSINLYGESLVKTIAFEKRGVGRTDTGLALLQRFWENKGIKEEELNMHDGSGLSPLNRVTTRSQVQILNYARSRPWFNSFHDALPEFNGMKMKSGTISGVKGFCGYHTSNDGRVYIFSFIVNNYNGRASALVNKMYKVLDTLK